MFSFYFLIRVLLLKGKIRFNINLKWDVQLIKAQKNIQTHKVHLEIIQKHLKII